MKAGADVNRSSTVQFGSSSPFVEGVTPLMCAARFVAIEIAKVLLRCGANPNAVDGAGKNALAYAIEKRAWYEKITKGAAVPELIQTRLKTNAEMIQLLSSLTQ